MKLWNSKFKIINKLLRVKLISDKNTGGNIKYKLSTTLVN